MGTGFLVDIDNCTGCSACALACTIENGLDPGVSWREVHTFNAPRHPAAPVYHLSLACNHCAEAPCMDACPALAYSRDAATGTVQLDGDRCIGCGYCSWACPFDAPKYDSRAGVMTKCTLCRDRLAEGRAPACVAACPTEALGYGELDASGGVERVAGFPASEAQPAIRFIPGRRASPDRLARPQPGSVGDPIELPEPASRIRLGAEWPLAVFSLLIVGLAGWIGAAFVAPRPVAPAPFLALAALATAVSTLHLGRPARAWRAVLNLRRSWLSREILAYSVFVFLSALALAIVPESRAATGIAFVSGLVCLFSIDRVYDVARSPGVLRVHSADTLLSGLFVAAVLGGRPTGAVLLGGLKAALYLSRKLRPVRRGATRLPALSAARVVIGFAVPLAAWLAAPVGQAAWIAAGVAAGEILDRLEFYAELDVPGPGRRVVADLRLVLEDQPQPG